MSQAREIVCRHYLIQHGHVHGIMRVERDENGFVVWYQTQPFGEWIYLENLRSGNLDTTLHLADEYFQKQKFSIQIQAEEIDVNLYRNSMWFIFKTFVLPSNVLKAMISEARRADEESIDHWLGREIECFHKMRPIYIKKENGRLKSYVSLWRAWLKEWDLFSQ